MSDLDDDELFQREMQGVEPIKLEKKVSINVSPAPSPGAIARRQAAEAETEKTSNHLAGDYVEPVDPLDILSFRRPGVQHGVFRNLRLGKYKVEARLDLHRMTVEQARQAVFQFCQDCLEQGIRCALITHGKGRQRQPQPALLKSCVAHWLPQLNSVLAFHSALKPQGGTGATYILLRKGESERQKNREKFAGKRH